MSEAVELSSAALRVLDELKDDPKPAHHYRPEVLNELHKARFVHDLANGGVGITKAGLDYLLPPSKPRPYTPPVQRANGAAAPTPPVTEPPAAPVTPPSTPAAASWSAQPSCLPRSRRRAAA